MLPISLVVISCFLPIVCYSQYSSNVTNAPALGPVNLVSSNASLLNFTFIYPTNFQFQQLTLNFTLYQFTGNATSPQLYYYSPFLFTNNNISLPWVVPSIGFGAGQYVIGCFQWIFMNTNNVTTGQTYACTLGQTSVNNMVLPNVTLITNQPVQTKSNVNITAYYPAILPYDQVPISSTLSNGTSQMMPTTTLSTSNGTYSNISTFVYTNLAYNTPYNLCVTVNFANSVVPGSQGSTSICQTFTSRTNGHCRITSSRIFIIVLLLLAFI